MKLSDYAPMEPLDHQPGGGYVDPQDREAVLREALAHPGPAIIEAVVDQTEPPLPSHVTTKQAWNFAKALARGQEDRWDILKTVATNTVREVV